ncbi:MAG: glycoside hydrolase family 3 C-terminal domain-containing protein [Flavisolibacter sp.]
MKSLFLLILTICTIMTVNAQSNKAKELTGKMTLEEKVNLVVGMGMKIPGKESKDLDVPLVGQTMDKVEGAAGTTFAIPRLGIPNTVLADGPAGLRIDSIRKNDPGKTYYATAWPVATLLASTWDTALVRNVGSFMGNEVKEYGVDVILAPGMNIQRNPLGGRNFEYYSEDPLVTGKIAAAMVNGIQSNGVGTSIKHFAANNQETHRNSVNTIVSERALREIYLKGFEIAVKQAHPWTVMSSYNKLNGSFTSEEYDLLTTILRKEWGFKGLVMTDWFGGKDAVAQMKSGNDLLMPGTADQKKAILDAVNEGKLDVKILDQNVERVIDYILNSPSYKNYAFSNQPDLKEHAALARKAASEGMVLLRNENNTLPIRTGLKKLAVFGNTSYDFISGGTGSGDVNEAYTISLVQGLGNAGYIIAPELSNNYTSYINTEKAKQPKKTFLEEFKNPTPRLNELSISDDLIQEMAKTSDAALITIGRNAGEGRDRKLENDFNLSTEEQNLLQRVSQEFHAKNKKVIVIVNSGGVIETASWRDKVDAILLTWQPGLEAGNAVVDILSGKVNPSGKLAVTFPLKYADVPSAQNFPGKEFPDQATNDGMLGMKRIPAEVIYEEGIYVGYRYYNTFHVTPAYEFGYGLSYTNFSYSPITLSSKTLANTLKASVTITNTGKLAGKEIVQLYVSAPKGQLDKPEDELKAFAKTNLLQPGQSQTIQFTLSASDLASYNTDQSAWVADAGTYKIQIGSSSARILQSSDFSLPKTVVTENCHKVLQPTVPINELKKLASKQTGSVHKTGKTSK